MVGIKLDWYWDRRVGMVEVGWLEGDGDGRFCVVVTMLGVMLMPWVKSRVGFC
jgi:hypothetical protein